MQESSEMDLKRILRLVYRKKKPFALIAALATSAIVIGGYMLPKTYEAKSVIFIEQNVLNALIKDVTVTTSFEEKIKALSAVMKSRNLILKVITELGLDLGRSEKEIEGMARNLQEKIVIEIEVNKATRKGMDLFTVSYQDSDPKRASDFVNALVRRYIEENLSNNRKQAYGASQFLLDQIAAFKVRLDKIETSISRHQSERVTEGKSDSQYERYQQLTRRKNELLLQYTENHPEILKLNDEIDLVKRQLRNETSPAGPDITLMNLMRERETTKKIYEELLATLRKSEVSAQVELQDKAGAFRILDPAIEPSRPISPNMLQIIFLALAGGIGAAGGILLLMDMSDSTVKSVETLKRMGLPVLAVISTMQTEREIAAAKRRDRRLYAAAGLYIAALLVIASMEYVGITAVDKFVQATKAEVSETIGKALNRT